MVVQGGQSHSQAMNHAQFATRMKPVSTEAGREVACRNGIGQLVFEVIEWLVAGRLFPAGAVARFP